MVVLLRRNEVCYGAIANSVGNRSVRFFKNTLERKFVLVGKRQNVGYFFLGFLSRVGTTDRFPLPVGAKHVFARLGKTHIKENFQHPHNEFHRSFIVVQKHDIVTWVVWHGTASASSDGKSG